MTAICLPLLAAMAASAAVCVRAKGGGKKRRPTEVDAEFAEWLRRRRRDTAAPPTYQEVRRVARRMYKDAGLSVPHSRHWQRQVPDVTDRRREHTAVRWLLTEFEQGRATSRPALAEYGQQPGGQFWAARLLARRVGMARLTYEDLAEDPRAALTAALGPGLTGAIAWRGERRFDPGRGYHSIGGNPDRFAAGQVEIRAPAGPMQAAA